MTPALKALSDLEYKFAQIMSAVAMAEVVHDDVLKPLPPEHFSVFNIDHAADTSWRFYALSETEDDAIHYALRHVEQQIRDLHKAFLEALDTAAHAEPFEAAS